MFKLVQADYIFYKNEYKGVLTETDFYSVLTEASAFVNALTRGKANNLDPVPDAYYLAICSVADCIYNENNTGQIKASESVGNHSVSYVNTTISRAESDRIKSQKAKMYLSGTGLLYCGLSGGGL